MKEIELIPIIQRNKDGELYQRSPEVESQIREALTLDRKKLIERADQKDYGSDDYFQEECSVYLIRAFRIGGEAELADKLMIALIDRCKKHIDTILRKWLAPHYIEDCFPEVIDEMIGQIFDMSSGKSNFAETRFWVWLDGRIFNVLRKYLKIQKEDSKTDNYEEHFRDSRTRVDKALERKDGLVKAWNLLTERERQIYKMRYDWKWQVFSEVQEVQTISKHFGVSARMVQKWFEKVEEKLRNGNKG